MKVFAIAGRELRSLLTTPTAYALFAIYLVFAGYIFFLSLEFYLARAQQLQMVRLPPEQLEQIMSSMNLNDMVIGPALGTFAIVFILIMPLLTMRAFSEERANGTMELLLTSPLSTWEIVLGKYLGVLSMAGLFVGLTALYPALLFYYGNPEFLQTLAGLLGLFLFCATLGAMGCFVSSLTQSQIVAAIVGIIAGLLWLLLDVASELSGGGALAETLRYLGIRPHFDQPLSGVIRLEDLVYFGVVITFFLALARTSVESLRWR